MKQLLKKEFFEVYNHSKEFLNNIKKQLPVPYSLY